MRPKENMHSLQYLVHNNQGPPCILIPENRQRKLHPDL